MRFIPTYCDSCSTSSLAAATSIVDDHADCPECGGDARIVPGLSYGSEDRVLFAELADTFAYAALSPSNASQLLAQIDSEALKGAPGQTLRQLARTLPALGSLQSMADEPGFPLRKAEVMLVTILAAHSTGRRQSGMMPAVSSTERKSAPG
jgi:hypothetical protein